MNKMNQIENLRRRTVRILNNEKSLKNDCIKLILSKYGEGFIDLKHKDIYVYLQDAPREYKVTYIMYKKDDFTLFMTDDCVTIRFQSLNISEAFRLTQKLME